MKFAKWVFGAAGLSGLAILLPMYFKPAPSAVGAEFYYGFIGIGSAWQVAFLMIAANPVKYRLMMLLSIVEKISFVGTVFMLKDSLNISLAAGYMDLIFAALFLISFFLVKKG